MHSRSSARLVLARILLLSMVLITAGVIVGNRSIEARYLKNPNGESGLAALQSKGTEPRYKLEKRVPIPKILPLAAQEAIVSSLDAWPYAPPANDTFYLISIQAKSSWTIGTLTFADLGQPLESHKESHLHPDNMFAFVLAMTPSGWQAAIESDPRAQELLTYIPESELSSNAREAMFPQNRPDQQPGTVLAPAQQYNGYKFPWPSTAPWVVTQGWHDIYYGFPANHSLDFDIRTATNSDILASASGTVSVLCDGTYQKMLVVTTEGTSEKIGYLHLDKGSVNSQGIGQGTYVSQGRKLGQMVNSDGAGSVVDSCGTSRDTHIHIYFPSKPFTIDGKTFSDQSINAGQDLWSSQGTTGPSAPTNLRVTGRTQNSISIAWEHNGNNVDNFRVRKYANGNSIGEALLDKNARYYTHNSLSCGTTYSYKVETVKGSQSAASATVSASPSCDQLPSPPTLQSPANNTSFAERQGITLSWSSTGSDYYGEIWGGPGGTLTFGWQGGTTKDIGSQWAGYTYSWHVRARNGAGESGWSNTWTFTVRPATPGSLSAQAVSCSQINLDWSDDSDGEDGFKIYRNGAYIGQVGANTRTYQSTGLSGGTNYSYTVRAYKGSIESDQSNSASATTSTCTQAPIAEFDAWPQSGNAPLTVSMHNISTGNYNSCSWEYGDGSTGSNCQSYHDHVYTSPGNYTVKLTVSGLGGSNSMTRSGYISVGSNPPTANFDAWPQSGTAPLTVSMHNISTGQITGCTWEYGDGNMGTSCADYHDHVYTNAGTYTVKLTVTGPGGSNTATRTNYISVQTGSDPKPAAPNNIQYSDSTQTSLTIEWQDRSDNETGFKVYQWVGSNWAHVGTVGAGVTRFVHNGLTCGTPYYHVVVAYKGTVESDSPPWISGRTASCASLGCLPATNAPASKSHLPVPGAEGLLPMRRGAARPGLAAPVASTQRAAATDSNQLLNQGLQQKAVPSGQGQNQSQSRDGGSMPIPQVPPTKKAINVPKGAAPGAGNNPGMPSSARPSSPDNVRIGAGSDDYMWKTTTTWDQTGGTGQKYYDPYANRWFGPCFGQNGGTIAQTPAVAEYNGQFQVVALSTDGAIYQAFYNPPPDNRWYGWSKLPVPIAYSGKFTSAPAIASYQGQFHVFARGSDNSIWHAYYDWFSARWFGWNPITTSTGQRIYSASAPAATAYTGVGDRNELHLLYMSTGGTQSNLMQMVYNRGGNYRWNDPFVSSPRWHSAPAVTQYLDQLQIWAVDEEIDGGTLMYYFYSPDGGWSNATGDYYALTNSIGSAPAITQYLNQLQVFYVEAAGTAGDTNGHQFYYTPGRGWIDGGRFYIGVASAPAVTTYLGQFQAWWRDSLLPPP